MLKTYITARNLLSQKDREGMYELFSRFFAGTNRRRFQEDLLEKNWIILLKAADDSVAGFSTVQLIPDRFSDSKSLFLFSGDTIVDKKYWQSSALAAGFTKLVLKTLEDNPGLGCYWFLISKGFRTYRHLPAYFKTFYPVYSSPTPSEYQKCINRLCRLKFGDCYHSGRGVIETKGIGDRLKPEMCVIGDNRLKDPHVRFFFERNPDFHRGDELACIAKISHDNFMPLVWRMQRLEGVSWHE